MALGTVTLISPLLAASPALAAVPAPPAAPAAPATVPTARQQLRWLTGASARRPLSATEIEQHVDAPALAAIGGVAVFNTDLEALGTLTLRQVLRRQPASVEAITNSPHGAYFTELATDPSGLIDGLTFSPQVASPRTWRQLDTSLRALAPQVSFAASVIDPAGRCTVVHGVSSGQAGPLGSAFKLYVLGALGQAVAGHRASWGEKLAIHQAWKSLPSGVLQNEPAGTKLTLRQYADYMISISDNTAADHLIHFLGRPSVQAQLSRFGNRHAKRDIPFLTTRELFDLKGVRYPALAASYLAMSRRQRAAELPVLDRIPLTQIHAWTQPEKINQIEWFGSPADICRAYAGLWRQNARPGLAPIGQALSINDGSLGLPSARYPLIWYKGGSEPGVLTLNYLVRTVTGQVIVSSVMLASPASARNENAIIGQAIALARGGIQLASRSSR